MKTILFAEDNQIVVQAYRTVLTREGFNVDVAEDGIVAMEKLSAAKPDLVLLDLLMPKINGTDVLKYIRKTIDLKTTPVILLSDCNIADLAQNALAIGVEGILLKSQCTAEDLVKTVNDVLNGIKWDVPTGSPSA
jgi:CheY-like chemotaxis protein